jgi:hypothetical protein
MNLIQAQWFSKIQKSSLKAQGPYGVAGNKEDPKTTLLASIRAKLKAGKKLSPAELDFLRENDPELYAKAVKVALERQAYESALRSCEDREEVENLRAQQLASAAKSDPEEGEMRRNALSDVDRAFRRSQEYAKLPAKKKEGATA